MSLYEHFLVWENARIDDNAAFESLEDQKPFQAPRILRLIFAD